MGFCQGGQRMLGIILILLLVWAGLVVLLWAGSVWFQGYIYSEPAPQLVWGAPVAGSALALFLALWCIIDYKSPGRYVSLFDFSARDDRRHVSFDVQIRDSSHRAEHCHAAGFVKNHLLHLVRRFDRNAAAVECDRFPYQRDRVLPRGAAAVLEDNESRRMDAPAADGEQAAEFAGALLLRRIAGRAGAERWCRQGERRRLER